MQTHYFPASERGLKDIGWLKSNFYFSFSDFYHPMKSAFGTLVAFNDDYVEQGKGFGIHPHLNMEIISVLLKGKMNHKDTLGYSTVIEEGGVQIMSAGTGLRHEEYNIGEEGAEHCWINQNTKMVLGHFEKDQTTSYQYNSTNKCLFVFLMEGSIKIGDQIVQPKDALGIWDTDNITIEIQEESHFIIIETVVNQK